MCGRTACTLAPEELRKACGHHNRQGDWSHPQWHDPPGGQKYYPSYNMCPGSHTPVLLSNKHIPSLDTHQNSENNSEWAIQPMQWGLVPSWHTGNPKKVQFNMTNARSDGMLSKTTYKQPLEKGRRCVVLADGYFEWQTKNGEKQPYYIYFPKEDKESNSQTFGVTEDKEKRLLSMAGLFDVWKSKEDGSIIYSYSIITVDAHDNLNWIHHRMPAILNGEEEIKQWLDSDKVPLKQAVELIRSCDVITHHPVSKAVNKNTNKSQDCVQAIDLEKEKKKVSRSAGLMSAWLKSAGTGSNKRKSEGHTEEPQCKTHKS